MIEDTRRPASSTRIRPNLYRNVFELSNKTVADCMVPREKMAALELSTPPDKVLEAVRIGAHTRMPVYEGDLDKIVGIVNTKRPVLPVQPQGRRRAGGRAVPADCSSIRTRSIANALRLFKKSRRPMALVRDDAARSAAADARGRAGGDRRRHRGRARSARAKVAAAPATWRSVRKSDMRPN